VFGPDLFELLIDLGNSPVSGYPDNDMSVGIRRGDCYGVAHTVKVCFYGYTPDGTLV
jgi:hypothetical protein